MGLFSKKTKEISDDDVMLIDTEDEILGSLDELFRQRAMLMVRTKEKRWFCNIYQLDAANKVMRIEDSPGLHENNGKPIQCGFALDRTYFVFPSKLVYSNDKPYVLVPKVIKQTERRKNPRVTISTREKVSVTILEGLGRGVGMTGSAVDLGSDGICLLIERALRLENEQKVSVHADLLKKGSPLAIIKIKGIPGVPAVDAEGIVNRISGPGGWKLAIQFTRLPGSTKSAIEKFVASRYISPNPMRRSFQKIQDMHKKREVEMQSQERKSDKPPVSNILTNFRSDPSDSLPKRNDLSKNPPAAFNEKIEKPTLTPLNTIPDPIPSVFTELEIPPPPPRPTDQKNLIISLGEELTDALSFLSEVTQFDWIHVESPIKILKLLNERNTSFLLLPVVYKRQSLLEYLEKMNAMGVLADVNIVMFASETLLPKDVIKCRMLGIQKVIVMPLKSNDQILSIILPAKSESPDKMPMD